MVSSSNRHCSGQTTENNETEQEPTQDEGCCSFSADDECETSAIAIHAICELEGFRNPQGPTYKTIVSHISRNYCVELEKMEKLLPAAMLNGLTFGLLRKENDRYKINNYFLNPEISVRKCNDEVCKRCNKLKRPKQIKIALKSFTEVPHCCEKFATQRYAKTPHPRWRTKSSKVKEKVSSRTRSHRYRQNSQGRWERRTKHLRI